MENLDYKIKREKFLCEAMGICWHDVTMHGETYCCNNCLEYNPKFANFSTWECFGKLFEWATQQDWFSVFVFRPDGEYNFPILNLVNPDRLADEVYEFLMEAK
jgi:hypothetical protein